MRASHRAVVRGNGTVSVLERPTPVPVGNELLVAPIYAGLCGTDIQMLRGLRSDPSPVIGHEGVARIVAAGSSVSGRLPQGALVCINPTHRGDPSFLLGHNVEGLLQERVLIKDSAVRDGMVIPLSEISNTVISTLMEPLAVVHYALGLLAESCPHTIVVFGDGVIGHIAVRSAAKILGSAIRIVHLHHTEKGMEWSRNHQVPFVHCALHDSRGARLLSALPEDERVAVLLATPRDATLLCLDTALGYLRGELIIDLLGGLPSNISSHFLPGVDLSKIRAANCAGTPAPAIRFSLATNSGKAVCLLGHRGVAHRHLRTAIAELAENPLRYRELITHIKDLDEAAIIMRQLSVSQDRVVEDRRLIKLAVKITSEPNAVGVA